MPEKMNVNKTELSLASAIVRISILTFLSIFISSLILFPSYAQIPEGIRTVRPVEIDDVLMNPGIGFSTFQMFNGDNHKANQDVLGSADLERYRNSPIDLENFNM